jgi:hypothetical protein
MACGYRPMACGAALGGRYPATAVRAAVRVEHAPPGLAGGCALLAAVVAAAVYALGPPGGDSPAHDFQTLVFKDSGFELWNNYWYAGRYEFIGYSVLYYPLAAAIGQGPVTAIACAVLAGAFAAVVGREWGAPARSPAIAFAATASLIAMVSGVYPFLAGAAAVAVAILCLQRRRPVLFALAVVAALAFSPLAFALLLALLAGVVLGQPRPVEALRRHRVACAVVIAVLATGVLVQWAFPSGGRYPFPLTNAAVAVAFSLAGLYVSGTSPRARLLRGLFAVYLALNLAAFVFPGPIGSNSTRLFAIAGAPLLWLAANVAESRSRRVVAPVLAVAMAIQLGPFVRDGYTSWHDPAADARFWTPALQFLAERASGDYRVEVVATRNHWEAYYLPRSKVPLARGWYRQDDFPLNAELYEGDLTGAEYRTWLRHMGVRFVLLPHAPLDYSAGEEADLLESGRSGLELVRRTADWSIYRLPYALPIVTSKRGKPAPLLLFSQGRVAFFAPAAGEYVVRVRHSPYWRARPADACITKAESGMTTVRVESPAVVSMRLSTGLGDVAEAVARVGDGC